ncbi:hypothetical protein [Streptomyces paludis]|uniref:Uncharacterized protein n=1 Tax=Streptomyces paludis TaxID=2282738 RepID=A0A345HQS5_9ACTN|nr:hypothetical protein [Streptomyces paludis]AXG79049.1 hypothetical protein DVK44_16640 [Streptomyces paludis]
MPVTDALAGAQRARSLPDDGLPTMLNLRPPHRTSRAADDEVLLRRLLEGLRRVLLTEPEPEPTLDEIRHASSVVLGGKALAVDPEELETLFLTMRRYVQHLIPFVQSPAVHGWPTAYELSLAATDLLRRCEVIPPTYGIVVRLAGAAREMLARIDSHQEESAHG